jgi:hypothetical protein
VAFGNYAQSWNFSSRTGTATISNLERFRRRLNHEPIAVITDF